jgi:hypothetical protein
VHFSTLVPAAAAFFQPALPQAGLHGTIAAWLPVCADATVSAPNSI